MGTIPVTPELQHPLCQPCLVFLQLRHLLERQFSPHISAFVGFILEAQNLFTTFHIAFF